MLFFFFCFFKQKTAYEMRISDWSSDVCSSDLLARSWSMDLPPPDDSGEIAVGVKGQRTILFVRPTGALNEAEEPMWIAAIEGLARADARILHSRAGFHQEYSFMPGHFTWDMVEIGRAHV